MMEEDITMGKDIIPFFGEVKDTMSGIIKVIGVGGGGCNAVRNMYKEGVQGVTYAVCNTDSQSLSGSPVPVKLLLGESGLGAGANPELGRSEAESKRDSIEQLLNDGEREIELQPVHKAVYLLFLAHPEGIEFKRLSDYRTELMRYYMATARWMDRQKIEESVNHLTNPLDNAINEKCSRIKKAFTDIMDDYRASYYIISSHTKKHINGSTRIWYERLKVITLPRELVVYDEP